MSNIIRIIIFIFILFTNKSFSENTDICYDSISVITIPWHILSRVPVNSESINTVSVNKTFSFKKYGILNMAEYRNADSLRPIDADMAISNAI